MPEETAVFAAVLLAAVFVWAAASKLFSYRRWNTTLDGYGLPLAAKSVAAPLVPVAELATAVLLIVATRAGAAAALALLSLFCLAIFRARSITGDKVPCGCFGGSEHRDYRAMLWRNTALILLSAAILGSDEPVTFGVPDAP